MTLSDLHLIRTTFAGVQEDAVLFANLFRQQVTVLDPRLAAMLPAADHPQTSRFMDTIGALIDGLDAEACQPAIDEVYALRHCWPGIQPRHYGVIGQAFLDALAARLRQQFTDGARTAWAHAFVTLAEALMARCYNPLGLAA